MNCRCLFFWEKLIDIYIQVWNWKFFLFFFYCCCVFHFLLVSLFVCLYPLIGTPSSTSTSRKFIFFKKKTTRGWYKQQQNKLIPKPKYNNNSNNDSKSNFLELIYLFLISFVEFCFCFLVVKQICVSPVKR